MSQEVNERILEALNAGHNPQDILGALSMSKDPAHQAWYENYSQTMRDRARETDVIDQRPKPAQTSNIGTVRQHIEETPAWQLGLEATGIAGGLYAGKRIIDRLLPSVSEKQYAEQNRIAAENLRAKQSGELSPLEQARVETEKAKAEVHRKRIEMMDKKMAQDELKKSVAGNPVSSLTPDEQLMLQRSNQAAFDKAMATGAKEAATTGVAPAAAPQPVPPAQAPAASVAGPTPVAPYDQGRMANMMASQEMVNPLGGQASAYTEPLRPAGTTAEPSKVEPPKNKGGRPTKAAKEAQVAGGVFKEGFGGADNWMQSQVGHDIRRFIKDEFNAGKPYGGGQAAMDKAYADIGKYEQWLKENIPVQTLNKAERKAVGVPSPEPYGPLGKAMKVGGVAGLLMTAANAANAKQAMQNVGEALLPIGMTPSELASGTLTEKQLKAFQEAQKLGSPYRSVPPPR